MVGKGVLVGIINFSFSNFIESIMITSLTEMPFLNSIFMASIISGLKTGNLTVKSRKLEFILPVIGKGPDHFVSANFLIKRLKVKYGYGGMGQGWKLQSGGTRPT